MGIVSYRWRSPFVDRRFAADGGSGRTPLRRRLVRQRNGVLRPPRGNRRPARGAGATTRRGGEVRLTQAGTRWSTRCLTEGEEHDEPTMVGWIARVEGVSE